SLRYDEHVLPDIARDVLVRRTVAAELQRDREHVERVHRHPAGAIRLLETAAGRQRLAAIEHADVVEAEEAALEDVHPFGILAVHPPGEITQQLVEDALEELHVALAAAPPLDFVDAPSRPCM